ncbi:MAG: hypothetical protein JWQ98_3671 [Chlorobi bacterium]|nr:hypothetical protein [Chlorobiota bacterium]
MEAYMYWRTIFRLAWGGSILLIALGTSGARFALGHLPGDIVIATASAPIHLPVTTTFLISFVAAGIFYFISSFFSRN